MSLAVLLQRYGYVVVLLGTFVEGETILVMGGFAAHQGYLHLPFVVLAAFVGSLAGDQTAFFVGRRFGPKLVERFPKLAPKVERAKTLLEKRGTALLVGFRFVYGIRNVTPVAAGLTGIPVARFFALNAIGAALWSVAVAAAGFAFGRGIEAALAGARRVEEEVLATLAVVGIVIAVVHAVRARRKSKGG